MEGKQVNLGSGFSTVSSNSSRFGCNQFCKIVYLILTSFQILSVVAHKIICSNPILFLYHHLELIWIIKSRHDQIRIKYLIIETCETKRNLKIENKTKSRKIKNEFKLTISSKQTLFIFSFQI